MKNARLSLVVCAVFVMMLGFFGRASAAPVPLLESERNAVWEAAWETAWEIAWQAPSELTVEFSGDVQGEASLDFVESFPQVGDENALNLDWGVVPPDVAASEADTPEMVASFGLPWAEERASHGEFQLGKLYVDTTPADARISLLHADKSFSQGMDLSEGEYVIEVVKEGYEAQVRRVEVLAGMAATVRMDLVQVATTDAMASAGYAPPEPEAATPEQLAKNLAMPHAASAGASAASSAVTSSAIPETQAAAPGVQFASAEKSPASAAAESVADGAGSHQAPTRIVESREQSGEAADRGSLRVTTTPAEATVRILDIHPTFEQGMALEPGTYTIDAQLYGYGTVTREVTIEPGSETSLDITLEELPVGRLYVKTVPEQAYVRILDIRPRFQQGMELAEGEYTIDATVSGYETVEKKVQVKGGQETVVTVALEQVAPTGRLYVDTMPEGATVRVLGILPKFHQGIELAEGTYTIDATTAAGERVEKQVVIEADSENRYTVALGDEPQGQLFVQTEPADATVRILDIAPRFEQGMTLEPGTYTIDVAQEGYGTKVQQVTVLPGRETSVSVALASEQTVELQATAASQPALVDNEPLLQEPEAQAPLPITGMAAGEVASQDAPEVQSVSEELDLPAETAQPATQNDLPVVEADADSVRDFDIEVFLSMAQLALNAGDFMGALDAAGQVLSLDPENADAFKVRSEAYLGLGQYSDAVDAAEKGLARSPGNEALQEVKQHARSMRQERDAAEESGSTAISLDPGYYEIKAN